MNSLSADKEKNAVSASESDLNGESGKIKRISQHTRSLVDDVKSWVELKMTLTQMEIEEKVDEKVNEAVTGAMLAALAFMAALFGLTAAALGLGEWLGHPAWGFLIVAAVLVVVALVLLAVKPKVVDVKTPELSIGGGTTDGR